MYGIPCHAWNFEFFEMLAKMVGTHVCCDDNTLKPENMDIARFLVRTSRVEVLNEVIRVVIDGEPFTIKITKDMYGP